MNRVAIFHKQNWPAWTADAVALLGLLIYLLQSIIFAHTTISNLDEGAYLLKGTLFVSGEYRPFDPGISTNKAPLAFLIPGYVQLLFGAGLRTGRYLAVFFGVMAVIGTWVTARRIAGKWLAAAAVWVFTCSPVIIKIYSGGATQSTIACLLAWTLALCLGEKRSSWQLILSGFLAGVMMLVRQNMLPVLPLVALYAIWQHGRKAVGLLVCGSIVVIAAHIIYWPQILQLWNWIPLIPLPEFVKYNGGGSPAWAPEIPAESRLLSIFQAVRFHFVVLVGSFVSLLLWPRTKDWKSQTDFRMAVFLFVLFGVLILMHSLAAVGKDYCVFCFTPYLAFFNVAGILLTVVCINSWVRYPSSVRQVLLIAGFFIISAGVGLSAFEDIGNPLLKLPVPRMRDMKILSGLVTVEEILTNKFQINHNDAMRYVSAMFGLMICALVLGVIYLGWRRLRMTSAGFATYFSSIVLLLTLFLSPLLHGSAAAKDCSTDVILANEKIGEYLQTVVPPGSRVYWDGGLSTVPLLYLPGIKIFPAQINGGYSFISNGDTAELFRLGWWNEEMREEWKADADFFIIEEKRYGDWKEFLSPNQFDEFERSPADTSCLKDSGLRIFRRK